MNKIYFEKQDALIDGLFNKVSRILRNCNLTEFLQEGRTEPVLCQGLSPYLPDAAFVREDGTIPIEAECRIENLENFKWGIEENILKREDVLGKDNIRLLDDIIAIINSEIVNTKIYLMSKENTYKAKDIMGNDVTIPEYEADKLVKEYNDRNFIITARACSEKLEDCSDGNLLAEKASDLERD